MNMHTSTLLCVGRMLIMSMLIAVAMADVVDPDDYSPLFPLPLKQSNGSAALSVPSSLKFTASTNRSEVLLSAIERYRAIIFAWGDGVGVDTRLYSGSLLEVQIEVRNVDDSAATLQLGMDESYELTVPLDGSAKLAANTIWGALRGLESFSQLVEWRYEQNAYFLRMAPWSIVDEPRFPHRGVLIDTARHYLSVSSILRQIDALAYCKLNTLHWHAVDGDSFPVQSTVFPSLSQEGAYTPTAVYTPDDVAAIVEHARFRGVRVVGEFDLPGHCTSWSLALPDLFVTCAKGADGDFGGTTRVLDITKPEAYSFLDRFIGEMGGRLPDGTIHLGGDEVNLGCVNASASMASWRREHPNATLSDLYLSAQLRMHAIAAKHSKSVTTWADVFLAFNGTDARLPHDARVQVWGREPSVAEVVKAGNGVIRSTGYYLNGGFSTGGCAIVWEQIYNDDPMPEGLSAAEQKLVLGGEAAMWGEVTDEFNIDSKTWLRAAVLSERYWSANETIAARVTPWPADYTSKDINARMVKHRCRLLQRGIRAQPYNTQSIPDRSRWMQCELYLPPRTRAVL